LRIMLFSSQLWNVLIYARAFTRLDHDFIIVTLVPLHQKAIYERQFSRFEHIESSNVRFSPIFLRATDDRLSNLLNPFVMLHDFAAIFRTLNKFRPDAIIGKYILHAYPLALLRRVLNFTLFVIVSGGDLELSQGVVWRIIRKFVCANSKRVFAVANRLKRELEEETRCRALVFPTGADTDCFKPLGKVSLREKHGYRTDDIIVLTLCQLLPRKCIDDIIRAFRILKNTHRQNLKLIIAGDGPERVKLEQLCSELQLEEDVSFLGFVDKTEKLELFNIADIYVIASYQEGLPFSLTEAMSCGCVCIASRVGDISAVIDDGVNGFLITPREPEALATKMGQVMSLPREEVLSIKRQARRRIVERFDFTRSTRAMIEVVATNTTQVRR